MTTILFAQASDLPQKAKPGACYAKCLISSNKDFKYATKVREFPVFIGESSKKVKTKMVTVEVSPAEKEWVKKQSTKNCLSADPNDCLIWCLQTTKKAEYLELEVLKHTRKLSDDEWEYKQVEVKYKKTEDLGGGTVWKEVICENNITPSFLNKLNLQLKEQGYDSGTDGKTFDSRLKSALTQFQRKNSLPVGQLDLETIKALNLK